MSKIIQKIGLIIISLFIIEVLSFSAIFSTLAAYIIFAILVLATFIISIYNLEYGLLIVLGELFVGSMGHLFFISLGSYNLSIRVALWLVIMLVFVGKFIRQLIIKKQASPYLLSLKNFSAWKILSILGFFILVGVLNGLGHHNNFSLILLDFNAWPYFLLIFPAIVIYDSYGSELINRLKIVFLASTIFLSLETLFLLFIFTHASAIGPDIYLWLRKTIVGEITPTTTGWPRIFIQGQSFLAIGFFILFWRQIINFKFKEFFSKINLGILIISGGFLSALLLSFSRSFWVALIGVLVFSFILIWYKFGFKKILIISVWLLSVLFISLSLIYLTAAWPYWHAQPSNFGQSLLARTNNNNDAAVASRWSLLPVLMKTISREPLLGQGFGSTITYFSQDPRVLQNNPGGEYTTYAFEWGYLSMWLKIGFIGLLVYLLFLLKLIKDSLRLALKTNNYLFFALPAGVLFLVFTNIFTPYLNHPLGIGFIIISSCLIWLNRVY